MSAARVLRHTLVRRNPDTLVAEALLAGKPVPGWAKDLVEDDDLVSSSDYESDDLDHGLDIGLGDDPDGDPDGDEPEDYSGSKWTVKALKAEVEARNSERADDDPVEVEAPGNKPELIAALVADDAAQAETE